MGTQIGATDNRYLYATKPSTGEKMGDKYRVKNWSEYDAGLKQRGSLTFWVNEEVLKSWLEEEKTGKQGASPK